MKIKKQPLHELMGEHRRLKKIGALNTHRGRQLKRELEENLVERHWLSRLIIRLQLA